MSTADLISKQNLHSLVKKLQNMELNLSKIKTISHSYLIFNIPLHTILFKRHGETVIEKDLIAELTFSSGLENQRHETEQEVFTPLDGQVFFENLILVEKIQRDQSVQTLTYGLGSLWVIAGTPWASLFNQNFFPSHGDFIAPFTSIQKFQVLIDNSYYLDIKLLNSILNFQKFRIDLFSIYSNKEVFEFNLLNNFFLSRSLYYIKFKKIYYKNFCYFIQINFKNWFLNLKLFKKRNFLSLNKKFIKNTHFYFDSYTKLFGLNFNSFT